MRGACWGGGRLHLHPQGWQSQLVTLTQKSPTCYVTLNSGQETCSNEGGLNGVTPRLF